ncbi:MAG TPA: hypothetical protein VFR20_05395 [Burkholderiaceae bacterium]|nr:hypothetical protein [Burkholderiaceae bacterium]
MNSKGCSFLVALLVVIVGLGIGYSKFRAQQRKALHDVRIEQWHGPLLAMLGNPVGIRYREQTFSVSGYLCGEFSVASPRQGQGAGDFQRFVVSPNQVVITGARAYTPSKDDSARRQRQDDQASLDALLKQGATPQQAFNEIAWGPHCR